MSVHVFVNYDLLNQLTPRHLAESQLVEHHLAGMQWWPLFARTSEPVMLPSIEETGAKLGEGMWAIEKRILDTYAGKQLS